MGAPADAGTEGAPAAAADDDDDDKVSANLLLFAEWRVLCLCVVLLGPMFPLSLSGDGGLTVP